MGRWDLQRSGRSVRSRWLPWDAQLPGPIPNSGLIHRYPLPRRGFSFPPTPYRCTARDFWLRYVRRNQAFSTKKGLAGSGSVTQPVFWLPNVPCPAAVPALPALPIRSAVAALRPVPTPAQPPSRGPYRLGEQQPPLTGAQEFPRRQQRAQPGRRLRVGRRLLHGCGALGCGLLFSFFWRREAEIMTLRKREKKPRNLSASPNVQRLLLEGRGGPALPRPAAPRPAPFRTAAATPGRAGLCRRTSARPQLLLARGGWQGRSAGDWVLVHGSFSLHVHQER